MHHFEELIYRSTDFALHSINKLHVEVSKELDKTGSTSAVKNLQMMQLHKVIIATGMLSIFEANLQDRFNGREGFKTAKDFLKVKGEVELFKRFELYLNAINVLKHGRGSSYNWLLKRAKYLPFKIKLPGENFFFEGDVSEVSTLIEVTDEFVLACAELIQQVSAVLDR